MTVKGYLFATALICIAPVFLVFVFINIYRNLKRRKVIKKLGRSRTITLFVILGMIAVLVFGLLFAATHKVYILGVLIYLMSIYFILEKAGKIIVKKMLR